MRIGDWRSDVCSSDLTDKLKFPYEMLFRPACLGEALAAALDTLAVKVHDARARGGIEVGFAMILGQGVLAPLDRADGCFGRCYSSRILLGLFRWFRRHHQPLEQQRHCDAGQDQRDDDDTRRQEDRKIERRKSRLTSSHTR